MTEGEMERMQQEAIRRTQEMHRRAASAKATRETSPKPEPESSDEEKTPPDGLFEGKALAGGIFDTLFHDKEKTLILGILLLLMDEKTDNGLLLALMYLLI